MEFKKTMKGLQERSSYFTNIARDKNLGVGWEKMSSHYEVYIENEAGDRIWEEIVLTRGIPTVLMCHDFWDIIEKELDKR